MGQRARRPSPQSDTATALEVALRYLASRPRTRWELERRLKRSDASDAVIGAVLARLTELGYVDDAAFARWWAEQRDRHAPRGLRMIEAELRQRGVPREVIEDYRREHQALDRAPEQVGLPSTEPERCREALERHLRGRPMPDDQRAVQRIGMYLMRRGFDPETVRSTLRVADGADVAEDGGGATREP